MFPARWVDPAKSESTRPALAKSLANWASMAAACAGVTVFAQPRVVARVALAKGAASAEAALAMKRRADAKRMARPYETVRDLGDLSSLLWTSRLLLYAAARPGRLGDTAALVR